MKKLIMLFFCGLLCSQAFASGYNRLYAGFSLMRFNYSECEYNKGAHLGYLRGINLTKDHIPLFLQFGGEAVYVTYRETYSETDWEFMDYGSGWRAHYMSVAVPLNVSYKIGKGDVTVEPFAGLNFRGNIYGKHKYGDGGDDDGENDILNSGSNHFQFGLNVGAGVNIKRLYVGYKFNPDLSDYTFGMFESYKSIYHHFSLGFNF